MTPQQLFILVVFFIKMYLGRVSSISYFCMFLNYFNCNFYLSTHELNNKKAWFEKFSIIDMKDKDVVNRMNTIIHLKILNVIYGVDPSYSGSLLTRDNF